MRPRSNNWGCQYSAQGLKTPIDCLILKFHSLSAFAPIANPTACAWGHKAFAGYLGEDRSAWRAHDATCLIEDGARFAGRILVDQGAADEYLEQGQLLPEHFQAACSRADQSLDFNLREGYDHSYYFVATFIESHIRHHAQALAGS